MSSTPTAERRGFRTARFDGVRIERVIQHTGDVAGFLGEAMRITRAGRPDRGRRHRLGLADDPSGRSGVDQPTEGPDAGRADGRALGGPKAPRRLARSGPGRRVEPHPRGRRPGLRSPSRCRVSSLSVSQPASARWPSWRRSVPSTSRRWNAATACTPSACSSPGAAAPTRSERGDEGNRTPDIYLAKVALCQLSYVPEGSVRIHPRLRRENLSTGRQSAIS